MTERDLDHEAHDAGVEPEPLSADELAVVDPGLELEEPG